MVSKKIFIEDVEDKKIVWREVYFKDIKDIEPNFIHEYKPTPGDRIYIFPNSSVPRFKLKSFCDKHNVSISKTKDKANILVADPDKVLESITINRTWTEHHIYKEPLLKVLRNLSDSMTNGLTQAILNSPENTFLLGRDFTKFLKEKLYFKFISEDDVEDAIKEGLPAPEVNYVYDYSSAPMVSASSEADYVSFTNTTFYHQDALNAVISEENIVINEELYQGFNSLLNSKNDEDHQIAMEGMANSNYKESMAYILLLFYEYNNEFTNHPSKHHVNFKSLVKYLNLPYRWTIDIDYIVKVLREKEVLTSANMAVVMKEAKKHVIENGETTCFKVTDVAPSDDIQAIMDETDAKLIPQQPDPIAQIEITDL